MPPNWKRRIFCNDFLKLSELLSEKHNKKQMDPVSKRRAEFIQKVGSKVNVLSRDGQIRQTNHLIIPPTPMIKALKSREIPIITRKWKARRRARATGIHKISTNGITNQDSVKFLDATDHDEENLDDFTPNRDLEQPNHTIDEMVNHDSQETDKLSGMAEKESKEDDLVKEKIHITQLERNVSEFLYPGMTWNLPALWEISDYLAPFFHGNHTHSIAFETKRLHLDDSIYQFYDLTDANTPWNVISSSPKNSSNSPRITSQASNPSESNHPSSLFPSSQSIKSTPIPTPAYPYMRNVAPSIPHQRGNATFSKSREYCSPFIQVIANHQDPKELNTSTLIRPVPVYANSHASKSSFVASSNQTGTEKEEISYQSKLVSIDDSRQPFFERYKQVGSCSSRTSQHSSSVFSSFSRQNLSFSNVKLGGLGPDKDNEVYRAKLEKMNRQKNYAENVRRMLVEKAERSSNSSRSRLRALTTRSDPIGLNQKYSKLPQISPSNQSKKSQIVINQSIEKKEEAIIKREKMKKYSESIKKLPILKMEKVVNPPEPQEFRQRSSKELLRLQREHMSSMRDVESIRRQLNL